MFSIVDLVTILGVIAIMFFYIIVIVFYWRMVNKINEESEKKVSKIYKWDSDKIEN